MFNAGQSVVVVELGLQHPTHFIHIPWSVYKTVHSGHGGVVSIVRNIRIVANGPNNNNASGLPPEVIV